MSIFNTFDRTFSIHIYSYFIAPKAALATDSTKIIDLKNYTAHRQKSLQLFRNFQIFVINSSKTLNPFATIPNWSISNFVCIAAALPACLPFLATAPGCAPFVFGQKKCLDSHTTTNLVMAKPNIANGSCQQTCIGAAVGQLERQPEKRVMFSLRASWAEEEEKEEQEECATAAAVATSAMLRCAALR